MLKEFDQDTIAAIATPVGEGGLGVIRMSGSQAIATAGRVFRSSNKKPVSEQASYTAQHGFIVSEKSAKIDEVILLLMKAPKSFTCEDVVEISAHGGIAVLSAILELLIKNGVRLAQKGEFTKRAFLNGRIDLLQAEAVLDLVKAKTELGRKWAASQLEGIFSKKMKTVRDELVNILSHLEASIDFPDDMIEPGTFIEIAHRLEALEKQLECLLLSASVGKLAKKGIRIVITGRPNVGKSSLMNCLTRKNRVIVTAIAGTTRDVVEEEIQFHGLPIRLSDTAGIQESEHPIEKEGMERSKIAVDQADLVLHVLDSSKPLELDDEKLFKDFKDKKRILVLNKSDLPLAMDRARVKSLTQEHAVVEASCLIENGVQELEKEIFRSVSSGNNEIHHEIVVSSVRQEGHLLGAKKSIELAIKSSLTNQSPELIAVDVRLALDNIGMLVGEIVTDDVLAVLFDQFCIGK